MKTDPTDNGTPAPPQPAELAIAPIVEATGLVVIDTDGRHWLVPFTSDGWQRRLLLPKRPRICSLRAADLLRRLAAVCGVPDAAVLHVH